MVDLIQQAVEKGAQLIGSISGGKDGQAMVRTIVRNGLPITALIHCDLGRMEWKESKAQCLKQASEYNLPLHILTRKDGRGLIEHMTTRLEKLEGTGKPFWPSSAARYCTSDLKREPSDKFFRTAFVPFIISCEGIRAQESKKRAKKEPLTIRWRVTSAYYRGMTAAEAIAAFNPNFRLVLTWYPVFNFTVNEVWATYGMDSDQLENARASYIINGIVPAWWPFHPAYAYGNQRVSCVFCVLGSKNDLQVGAAHRPELLKELISYEEKGAATFRSDFSLKQLL